MDIIGFLSRLCEAGQVLAGAVIFVTLIVMFLETKRGYPSGGFDFDDEE